MRWRNIEGFPNYAVSDTGLVKNIKTNHTLKPSCSTGYATVSLCRGDKLRHCKYVHDIVAEAFLGQKSEPVVRHLDGNKLNNNVSNLAYGSYSDNTQDAIRNKENKTMIGIKVLQYLNGKLIAEHDSFAAAARAIGLAHPSNSGATHIKQACEGKRIKTLKGFTFAYKKVGDSYSLE